MKEDFEKHLAESLKTVTGALRENRQERTARARIDFWRRYRRRRVTRFAPVIVVAGVTAVVAAFAIASGGDLFRPKPLPPASEAPPAGIYIGVARGPVGVSVGDGIVWVASKSGQITQVDPDRNSSSATIAVGGQPSDIAVSDPLVWYSDSSDGTVKRLGSGTGQFVGGPVDVGSLGHIDVDIGPKGAVWVASPDSGFLYAIDASSGDVVNQIPASRPIELGIGPGELWALIDDGQTLARFDFATGQESLRVSTEGEAKTDLAVTADAVFIASADGTITQVDAATGAVAKDFVVTGVNPELAVGKGALWVASDTGDDRAELARLDLADMHPIAAPKKFVGTPTDIALGEGSAWVTDSSRNAVVRLNASR